MGGLALTCNKAVESQSMPSVDHSRFYQYQELNLLLEAFASEFPRFVSLSRIGQSHEGRDILLVTLTDHDSAAAADKPAFWLDGNIHASELAASAACLYFIEWILNNKDSDDDIAYCLKSRTFYICPRINPDGAEWAMAANPRYVRSSTRRYPFDEEIVEGLVVEDIDGDGQILDMRIEDSNGPWKTHPDDERLLIRRSPTDRGGRYYRVLPEGRFVDFDPDRLLLPNDAEGLDLNRNFPSNWRQEFEQQGAGPFPGSEPEIRALLDFITSHKNICAGTSFHTFSGVLLRPSSQVADDKMPPEDLWIYQTMGKEGEAMTGYPALSMFEDFTYYPGQTLGGSFDWLYEHMGAFMWVVEIWDPRRAAGIETKEYIHWFRDHDSADDMKLLQWSDKELEGKGYLPWRKFQHPQLGQVEIGGWNRFHAFRNPPPERREAELARFPKWILWQALIMPRLEWRDTRMELIEEKDDTLTYKVRAVVENTGWLPSYVTKQAVKRKLLRGLIAELELPAGATLVSGKQHVEGGELEGRSSVPSPQSFSVGSNATADRAVFEWVVRAKRGSCIGISVHHERAGRLSRQLTLD
jgi:murein tripeptide amidase MpaA